MNTEKTSMKHEIMEKKELEFMERFLNIEKQYFTDFEKRISFNEMCGDMELNNNDIVEIVKSLTERINSFMLRK
jgi:hypothetical protein